ncbi:hypothetical protein [Pseudomonas syringae]|uniref:hypothetical protein n=1 Tax=Pseudomonas syringae TaxID=317 RepID=UPI0003676E27|nr:hypothetical protein [Pseudomonas syringae]MDU8540422.1 hypothetical protein [Pseudomonas syringae pv. actinidiae]
MSGHKTKINHLKILLVMMAVVFSLLAAVTINVIIKMRNQSESNLSRNGESATRNLGIHCYDGKAMNTTYGGGGFEKTEAVIIDGNSVECGMKYTVNNEYLTPEQLYVKFSSLHK